MKISTCGSSPRSGCRKAWMRIKNVNGASRLSNIWNFFGAIQMISCRDWWPWTKPGCMTMTRRQSNNQWSSGIATHPAPKNSECKNPLESSHLDSLGSRRHSPHWLSSKGQTINAEYYLSLLVQLKDILKENPAGISPRGSCCCTTMPRLTGHLQPRRNWLTWASSVLITHPILRNWPRQSTSCSLDWKYNWNWNISSDAEVIAAAETWFDGQFSDFF